MRQTIGFKRFVVTHVAATALAVGMLVSGALGVAGLAATGNLPWLQGGGGRIALSQPAVPTSLQAERTAQLARFFEAKLARQDAVDLQVSALAAQAAAHDELMRFYAHKEEKLLAMP